LSLRGSETTEAISACNSHLATCNFFKTKNYKPKTLFHNYIYDKIFDIPSFSQKFFIKYKIIIKKPCFLMHVNTSNCLHSQPVSYILYSKLTTNLTHIYLLLSFFLTRYSILDTIYCFLQLESCTLQFFLYFTRNCSPHLSAPRCTLYASILF